MAETNICDCCKEDWKYNKPRFVNLGKNKLRLCPECSREFVGIIKRAYAGGQKNPSKDYMEWRMEQSTKWELVIGVITPGGDPLYICPVCRDKKSKHINGVETHCHMDKCQVCGTKLSYSM